MTLDKFERSIQRERLKLPRWSAALLIVLVSAVLWALIGVGGGRAF